MTTGYIIPGRGDLDALFKARTSAAAAATNFKSNGGVDLSQRFEPRGATTAIAATGFVSAGVDLAQIFMALGAGYTVNLSPLYIHGEEVSPNSAGAGYILENTGNIFENRNGSNTAAGSWVTPTSAAPGAFQCYASHVSGAALTSGTLDTWLALTSSRSWSLSRSVNGSVTSVINVQIREGTGVALASANITLQATRSVA